MDRTNIGLGIVLCFICGLASAKDLSGLWKHVDDKTGTVKAQIQIRKEDNGSYTAKILKVLSPPEFSPTSLCQNCPAPFQDQPILGLDILSGLVEDKDGQLTGGRLLDPFNGETMPTKAKVSSNGNRLMLRSNLGEQVRMQVWMRIPNKAKN